MFMEEWKIGKKYSLHQDGYIVNIAYGTCYLFMLFIQSSFNMTKT